MNKCLLCGKKEITKHSLSRNHKKPFVPLCEEHHQDVENIKLAIRIMKREKKISIRRFRKIIDSFKIT